MGTEAVLWLVRRAADVPEDDLWLSEDERAVLAGLRLAPRRRDWRLGRWTAKQAVAAWLGPSWPAAEIVAAPDGAPEAFVDGQAAPLAISLTHRSGMAACAVGPDGSYLGCDLEEVEPRSRAFVYDWFTPAERALVESVSPPDRSFVTSLVWSAKESALKAMREGLRLDTREVVVSPGDRVTDGWTALAVEHTCTGLRMPGSWRRLGGLVLTIVARPGPDDLPCFTIAPASS